MPTKQVRDDRTQAEQDRLNPAAQLSAREQAALDQTSAGMRDDTDPNVRAERDAFNASFGDSNQELDDVADQEDAAGQEASLGDDIPYDSKKTEVQRGARRRGSWSRRETDNQLLRRATGLLRGRMGVVGLVTGLTLSGGILASMTIPLLAPFAFVQNVTDDVGDRVAALVEANDSILHNKLYASAKSGSLRGCGKVLSISCKMKTFSQPELARMKRVGIEVIEDGKSKIPGRVKAAGVKFHGTSYTPDEWSSELRTNAHARNAQLRANNMKYRGLSASGPFGWVMQRFNLSKKPPGVSGSKKDRVNQLLTSAGVSDGSNVKLVDVVDDDGTPTGKKAAVTDSAIENITQSTVDERGIPTYEGDSIKRVEDTINRSIGAKPQSLSATKKAAIGGASIFGVADLVCSTRNMIIGASAAAKVVTEARLATFGMPILASIGRMMASEASPEESEAVGDLLTEIDTREYIEAIDSDSINVSGNNIAVTGEGVTMIKNPNYKKSAMDAVLLSMSTNGGVAPPTETRAQFMVGMGASTVLASIASTAVNIAKGGALQTLSQSACGIIQNPFVRAGGIVLSVIAAIGSGGSITVGQVGIIVGMIAAMALLEKSIQTALSGDALTELMVDMVGRGEALWTAIAVIEAALARVIGLAPGGADTLAAQHALTSEVKQRYIAMEKEDAANNPLDITNRFSFLGAFTRSLAVTTNYSRNPLAYIPGSMIASIKMLDPIRTARALNFDPERFQQHDEEAYRALGITPDVQGNIRYVLLPEDRKLLKEVGPDGIVNYMEDNGYVEPETETGYPEGYVPPNLAEAQQSLMQTMLGLAHNMTIGQFFDSREYGKNSKTGSSGNEYGKYLEHCPFRVVPYGETGEEAGRIGGPGLDWETGANCLETGEMYSYFRTYRLLTSTLDMNEGEENFDALQTNSGSSVGESGTSTDSTTGLPPATGRFVSPIPEGMQGRVRMSARYGRYPGGGPHWGVDLAGGGDNSWEFVSACDGVVNHISYGRTPNANAYGGASPRTNYVWIRCDNGIYMGYAHFYQNKLRSYIRPGYRISAGTPIAAQGNQGHSTGPHLHLQINPHNPSGYSAAATIDPAAYLQRQGVSLPKPSY